LKRFLSEVRDGVVPSNFWSHEFAGHTDGAKKLIEDMFGPQEFQTPKPPKLIEQICTISLDSDADIILDYFAGSGTTGHAVININRKDGGTRKFILIEMGDYFDFILKPRIVKIAYSACWKDAKPSERNSGISHCSKYLRLESYEDTLNNLVLKRTPEQRSLLADTPSLKEEYMLSYMMDLEAEGSASLLNVDTFADPWNYKLKIATGSAGETKTRPVDLVETFNYLLGLTVVRRIVIRGIEVVEGTNPEGEKVLVIWRNTDKVSNAQLNEFFRKQDFRPREGEFNLIYVNGDSNLENFRLPDETWKVRLTEEEFKRLMFDVEDV
jgi:adenine-specific DNA-methyltransferase